MKKSGRAISPEDEAEGDTASLFPVVGVAAPVGGVESFRRVLPHLPVDTGMAFVIAPPPCTQPASVLASLLAGATPMPVREAALRTVLKPNHVYVIPPDQPMRIVDSVLVRAPRSEAGQARRPVDYFFRSLAADRGALGIGLMLSPPAPNDMTGLEAVRENGGITILQSESGAPSCLPPEVTPGIATLILPPEEIGEALERIGRTADLARPTRSPGARGLPGRLLAVVKNTRAVDLSCLAIDQGDAQKDVKRDAIMSLFLSRMHSCRCESLDVYLAHLESNSAERSLLGHDLLVSANDETQSVNGDLVDLIGGTSISALMVDGELRIKLMTPAAERMFNARAGDAGASFREILLRLSDEDLESRVRRVIDSGAPEEVELRIRDGRWHRLRAHPCAASTGRIEGAVITLIDIDELRRARSAAVVAGRFADAILESVPIPLLVLDADLKVLVANDAFLAAYALQAEDVQNRTIDDIGTSLWAMPEFKGAARRLLSGETAFEEFECPYHHAGLGKRVVLISARRVLWQGSARILIAIHDITAQRRAETLMAREKARLKRTARKAAAALQETEDALRQSRAELRALTGSLLHAQEEERRRVSRELHDDVSQDVVKLQFDIEALEQSLPPDRTREKQGLMAVRDDAARLSNDLRRIAYVLHPSTLDNLGLTGALSAYAAEFSKRTGIPIEFSASAIPEIIPQGIASAFYRVTQEALRNIVRHSGAASTLCLTGESSHLTLAIHDNGPGFDRRTVRGRGGLGLVSMEERARLIGASFQLDTAPGEGVSITLSAPLGLLD